MALTLASADGAEVEVTPAELPQDVQDANRAFMEAQLSDPAEDERRRPPRRTPRVAEAEETEARTEKPKRGRPSKADQARTTSKAPADKKPLAPRDFTADLDALGNGLWLGLSQLPATAPYAALLHMQQPAIVAAVNAGAQVNPSVRNFCDKLTSGTGNAWALQLGVVAVNVGLQGMQLARNPELRAQLAQANSVAVAQFIEQMGVVQAEQAAQTEAA